MSAHVRLAELTLGVLALFASRSAPLSAQDPNSHAVVWRRAGSVAYMFKATGWPDELGGATIRLWCTVAGSREPGLVMATLPAGRFRGRAVEIHGEILTRGAEGGASFWLRVEGRRGALLAEDYGTGLRVRGTSDWTPQRLVLPVPDGAEQVLFGLLLAGEGEVTARAVRVDAIDPPPPEPDVATGGWRSFDTTLGAPPPLDAVRDALAEGDTAWVVRVLTPRVAVTPHLDSRTLTDLLLLLWIRRSRGQSEALEAWRSAVRTLARPVDPADRSDAARVLRAAVGVELDEPAQALVDVFGVVWWRRRIAEIAASAAGSDPPLAAAARWVLVLDDMRWVRKLVSSWLPVLDSLPAECETRSVNLGCTLHTAPPERGRLPPLFAVDSTHVLRAFRTDLDSARAADWPFGALSARVRVAVAALVDDRAALRAFAEDTAGFIPRDAAAVRVMALAFAGELGRAGEEMAAHPEWYAGLDADLADLGGGRMAPDLFWRLAWPLFLQPYNERQVVHRARLLLADVLQHGVGDTVGVFDVYGRRAPLVQRGIPLAVAMVPAGVLKGEPQWTAVSYVSPNSRETLVRLGLGATPASLDLALAARDESALSTYSGYVAPDYDRLTPFEHQVAQYVRDGHRIVDVYAARPVAPACDEPDPKVGFFLLDSRLHMLREVVDTAPHRRRYQFRMVLAPAAYVYSLELLDRPCRLAARARYVMTVPPADATRLSDLVLAEDVALEEPIRVAGDPPVEVRPGLRVAAGGLVHFYWEVYRLDADRPQRDQLEVHFELVNVSRHRVALGELARLEAAVRRTKPLMDLQYAATTPEGTGPIGFGLSVTVPAEARGVYVARVTVRDRRTGWRETIRRALYVGPGG
jgi:hypothetical protein